MVVRGKEAMVMCLFIITKRKRKRNSKEKEI